jgi:ABC-type bacteriocin/lantibiotic exporter with double-glycine peptidase domain
VCAAAPVSTPSNITLNLRNISVMFPCSYGGSLVYDGSLSGGGFVAFCFVAAQVTMAAAAVPLLVADTRRAAASARRVVDVLQRQPRLPHRGGLTLQSVQGRVTWRGVSLRRPPHDLVADADIDAPAGAQPCYTVSSAYPIMLLHILASYNVVASQVCSRS